MFRVPSVILVTAMVDCKTRQKKEEPRKHKKSSSFEEILRETRKDAQVKDEIMYQAAGYTKDAVSYDYTVRKREYA